MVQRRRRRSGRQTNRLDTRERGLGDWNRRILSAVEAQYGPDSSDYELVGGTRRSERKKPMRPKSTTDATKTK